MTYSFQRLLPVLGLVGLVAAACNPPAPAKQKPNPAAVDNSNNPDGTDPNDGNQDGPGAKDGDKKVIQSADPSDKKDSSSGELKPGDPIPLTKRCATRLSIALAGKSPDATLAAQKEVAPVVNNLVASADFAERYARFINAEFNGGPGKDAGEDVIYFLAKHVITNDKPWSDLFNGPYAVQANGDNSQLTVTNDPSGLGYFHTSQWMQRYAGNESTGLMLVGAFRILSNTTGLELTPSVGNPGDDRTATGRMAAPCKSCHFDPWFALDKVARLLPRKQGEDMNVTFKPTKDGPQQLLGKTLQDDRALVNALVDSDSWRFAQCRTVFKFMYGRSENKCEAATFDRCVDALVQKKTIRAAVAAVATDPAVCK